MKVTSAQCSTRLVGVKLRKVKCFWVP